MKKRIFVFSMIFAAIIHARAANYPDWLKKPPVSQYKIYASGIAGKRNAAANLARAELSRVVAVRILNCMEEMERELTGSVDGEYDGDMVKAMSKHVSSTVLKHSKVEDVFQDRGNFYVLVSIDLADLQSFGGQNLNKAVAKINTSPVSPVKEKGVVTDIQSHERPAEVQVSESKPYWLTKFPAVDGYYTGIGEGSTLQTAQSQAISMIASQINVKIKSENTSRLEDINGKSTDSFSEVIELSLMNELDDLEFMGAYKSPDDVYSVYYRLNIAQYRAKQNEKKQTAVKKALNFYRESKSARDAALQLKYLLSAYKEILLYVNEDLTAQIDGKNVALQTVLFAEIQNYIGNIRIEAVSLPAKSSTLDESLKTAVLKVFYGNAGSPLKSFPMKIVNKDNRLKIKGQNLTDNSGNITYSIKHFGASGVKSFSVTPDLTSFLNDYEENSFLMSQLSSFALPEFSVRLETTRPAFAVRLELSEDLKQKISIKKQIQTGIKDFLENEFNAAVAENGADYTAEFYIESENLTSDYSGQYFVKLSLSGEGVNSKDGSEIFSFTLPPVKGGGTSESVALQKAVENLMKELAKVEID